MLPVAACIPTIPPRHESLLRAVGSVLAQTIPVAEISVAVDLDHEGAAVTRNRAWRNTTAPWIAFLDDDDEWLPFHLETLLAAAETSGADLVFPWFAVVGGTDPLAINGAPAEGHPFDDEARAHLLNVANHIPITVLVRREALEKVDGFPLPHSERWPREDCEDWKCWQDLLLAGFSFHHINRRTWRWFHTSANTSGLGSRW